MSTRNKKKSFQITIWDMTAQKNFILDGLMRKCQSNDGVYTKNKGKHLMRE